MQKLVVGRFVSKLRIQMAAAAVVVLAVTMSADSGGHAVAFNGNTDGSGSYVIVPDSDAFNLQQPFTLEAWLNWNGADGYRVFLSKPALPVSTGLTMVVWDGFPCLAAARAVDDRSQTARGLDLRGSVLTLQGDYRGARASFDESATIARGIGEKAVFTAAVDGLAGVDLAQGRVSDARQRLEEVIPVDRKTGDKSALALRLANLSAAVGMQGYLAEAEKVAAEGCAIDESLAAMKTLAGCRVRLAELWLAEGRQGDARTAMDRIGAQLGAVSLSPIDLARLADLYLSTGDATSAASTIAEARRVLDGRESIPEHAIAIAITAARIDAASGQVDDARRRLVQAKSEAERLGLLPLTLEARLAMAERSAPLGARAEAAGIERDADRAGLGLIASKARAINRSGSAAAAVLTTVTPHSAR